MSSVAPASFPLLARIVQARHRWRLVLALLLLVVGCLALMPAPPRELSTGWDKLNHVLAFAALAFSARLSFPRRPLWHVVLGLLAFGGLIELVQLVVPGRSCDWEDLMADAIGIAVGLLAARLVWRAAALKR